MNKIYKDIKMSLHDYPPLVVYKNLHTFLTYRKLVLVSGSFVSKGRKTQKSKILDEQPVQFDQNEPKVGSDQSNWLKDAEFIDLIQWDRFCIIEAADSETKERRFAKVSQYCKTISTKTFIIILDQDFDIVSADLTKILSKLPEISSSERNFNMDIIIISEYELPIHPKKKIEQYEFSGSNSAGYVSISNQLYTLFTFDIFKRDLAPQYHIVSTDSEEAVLQDISTSKVKLTSISSKEPPCIILGAVPGDLLEITGYNENTGIECRYRYVR